MEQMLETYKSLWLKSVDDAKAAARMAADKKPIRARREIREDVSDLEEFLWTEFDRTKENLYYLHLTLAEFCLTRPDMVQKESCVVFLNKTFDCWMRNYLIRIEKEKMRKEKTTTAAEAETVKASNEDKNNYSLEVYYIYKAFDLAMRNLNLLNSFNKIYKFDQNFSILRVKMDEMAQKTSGLTLLKVVNELKLNEIYQIDYESVIVPLMIAEKYKEIDELISTNEKTLISVIEVCDKICNENISFNKLAESYDMKASNNRNRFRGSQVAKAAMNWLKKAKKAHLVQTVYLGIQFQLRLNQLRFLINTTKSQSSDPMSFEAWSELVIDLIGQNEKLITQLFYELVHYNRDVNLALYFTNKYGYEYVRRLPPQTLYFFETNAAIMQANYIQNIQLKWAPTEEFYYPSDELKDENILFVDDVKRFADMLLYFETNKVDVIGLDCEWKPTFENDEGAIAETVAVSNRIGDKNQRANTFQIATREKTFVIEARDLVDHLDESNLDKFGALVLFNENLIKLGYNFDQDAQRLRHSFWKLEHRLIEFTSSIVNMDEVAADMQHRYKIISDESNEECGPSAAAGAGAAATGAMPRPPSSSQLPPAKAKSKAVKPKGLSKLVHMCFGKPLDKRECMSNWQNKPLRREQLRYAALDSYVLIKIHDLFQAKLKELNIDMEYRK